MIMEITFRHRERFEMQHGYLKPFIKNNEFRHDFIRIR
jgi:hypothetical protein